MTRAVGRPVRARRAVALLALAIGLPLLAGCGADPAPLGPAGIDELTIPTPSPDPADFTETAANAWFPLQPGSRWTYRRYTPAGNSLVYADVPRGRTRIDGVEATAIRWQVRHAGVARTVLVRWYAVDRAGNVWWFGQQVLRGGAAVDRLAPRSWQAGTHGARAGLVLSAVPRVGDGYFNALQPRVVARRSTVQSIDGTVSTISRTYRHAVVTRDLSSLAPLHSGQSFFVRGLGLVAQEDTVSTSTSLALVSFHRG